MINNPILILAIIFILGFFSAYIIKRLKIPVITSYVILGIILSPNFLNLISEKFITSMEFFPDIVLGMIAFSLGETFSLSTIKRVGRTVASISISESFLAWLFVSLAFVFIFKQPFYIAIVFGAIASATAPAAVVMVSQEYKSKGEFTDTLLGVVAMDDVWALIGFGLSLSLAKSFVNGNGESISVWKDLLKAAFEIGGAVVLGITIAVVFNKLSRLINTPKDRLIFTIGFLFLDIGLAIFFNFSVLLSCMFFGGFLVNKNKLSFEFFDSLKEIDAPLYLIFFVLAGASLKVNILGVAVPLILGYIVFRTFGKITGAFLGAKIAGSSSAIRKYMGFALIPQAGVALACALISKQTIGGDLGDKILTITIASTIVFELVGPSVTKQALLKAGDIKKS